MQLFIAAIYIRNPIYICVHLANALEKPTATEIRCGSVAAFALFGYLRASFIVTVPMSGTFALPLTEVSVKSSSIWASLPRSSRAVTVADRWLPTVESSLYFNFRRGLSSARLSRSRICCCRQKREALYLRYKTCCRFLNAMCLFRAYAVSFRGCALSQAEITNIVDASRNCAVKYVTMQVIL